MKDDLTDIFATFQPVPHAQPHPYPQPQSQAQSQFANSFFGTQDLGAWGQPPTGFSNPSNSFGSLGNASTSFEFASNSFASGVNGFSTPHGFGSAPNAFEFSSPLPLPTRQTRSSLLPPASGHLTFGEPDPWLSTSLPPSSPLDHVAQAQFDLSGSYEPTPPSHYLNPNHHGPSNTLSSVPTQHDHASTQSDVPRREPSRPQPPLTAVEMLEQQAEALNPLGRTSSGNSDWGDMNDDALAEAGALADSAQQTYGTQQDSFPPPPPHDNNHLPPGRPLVEPATRQTRPPSFPQSQPRASPHIRGATDSAIRNGHGVELISTRVLGDKERQMFPFETFNAVQSTVYPTAYESDDNMVVSAPTGSGKTTIFELAFLRMLSYRSTYSRPLAIYMAPTKALCTERLKDWQNRMILDITCVELTGDTDSSKVIEKLPEIDMIITTPEKWDSVTRRSRLGAKFLDRLALLMIDEVHILRETRGATLEVVVSRMKARGDHVRFIALSASVPNIEDVARWLGGMSAELEAHTIETMPMAKVFKFGEEFRPVPLKREVFGFDGGPNEFTLGPRLDKEVFRLLYMYSSGRPVLVFCPTRKACQTTADIVAKEYQAAMESGRPLPWNPSHNEKLSLQDSKIAELTNFGIAVHHAGLEFIDRRMIEDAFKASKLHLIVSTSTLAVGVNLPAHLVVIKGTSTWQGASTGFREYSDIDIQQMMGRAGRPQFDTSGTVVVMCDRAKVNKYRGLVNSSTTLESSLHENLTEHINSEIGLQTITDLRSAQDWLKSSFLYIRIQQNPKYYAITASRDRGKSWQEWLEHFVQEAVERLEKHEFIECPNDDEEDARAKIGLHPTPFGGIMSNCIISFATMMNIMTMTEDASLQDLLEILSGASEFADLRIRHGETTVLNKIRQGGELRYPLEQTVKTYADKVFIYLQVSFGNVSLEKYSGSAENHSVNQINSAIFTHAKRIARAIGQVAAEKRYGGAMRSALELLHTVNGKAWEDSSVVFRQIHHIGPMSIKILDSNGVHSWDDLIALDPPRLSTWINRSTQFCYEVIEAAKSLPRFSLDIEQESVHAIPGSFPIVRLHVTMSHTGSLAPKKPKGKARADDKYNLCIFFYSSINNRYIDIRRIETQRINKETKTFTLHAPLYDPDEYVIAYVGVEEKAGLAATVEFHPMISPSSFPDMPKPWEQPPPPPPPAKKSEATPERIKIEEDFQANQPGSASAEAIFVPSSDPNDIEFIDITKKPGKRTHPDSRAEPNTKRVKGPAGQGGSELTLTKAPDQEGDKLTLTIPLTQDVDASEADSLDSLEMYYAKDEVTATEQTRSNLGARRSVPGPSAFGTAKAPLTEAPMPLAKQDTHVPTTSTATMVLPKDDFDEWFENL